MTRLQGALRVSEGPASEPVSNVSSVAGSASKAVVQVVVVDRAAVVKTSSSIVSPSATVAKLAGGARKGLLDAITIGSTRGTVTDHEEDLVGRARVNAVAAARPVVGLHKTGVEDAVVGSWDTDAALALLHDNGEDEAVVDASLSRDLLDGAVDVVDLLLGVVSAPAVPAAGLLHQGQVGGPELIERAPGLNGGPASTGRAVTLVEGVLVGDGGGGRSGQVEGAGRGTGSQREGKDGNLSVHFEG